MLRDKRNPYVSSLFGTPTFMIIEANVQFRRDELINNNMSVTVNVLHHISRYRVFVLSRNCIEGFFDCKFRLTLWLGFTNTMYI